MTRKRTRDVIVPVAISAQVFNKLQPILDARGITAEELCLLYLRSLVTASEKAKAITLRSEMPFGKYKGEIAEIVIRAEPRYVAWLVANSSTFDLDPEAIDLLNTILETEATK